MARRLVDLPGAEVGLDLDSRQQLAVGLDHARRCRVSGAGAAARRARAPSAALRSGARPRSAGRAPRRDPRRSPGCAPTPGASRARSRRRRRSGRRGRSGRCGRGCRRPGATSASSKPACAERELELAHAVVGRHPGVEEDDPVAGGDRERVHVRNAGPGQRQAQPPDARQDPLAAGDLAASRAARSSRSCSRAGSSRADTIGGVPADASANAALIDRFYEAFARQDGEAMAACYTPDAHFSDPVFTDLHGEEVGRDVADALRARHRPAGRALGGRGRRRAGLGPLGGRLHVLHRATGPQRDRGLVSLPGRPDRRPSRQFDLWAWSRQALGPLGVVLGWSPPVQGKIRAQARAGPGGVHGRRDRRPTPGERAPLRLGHVLAARRAGADPRPRRRRRSSSRASRPPSTSCSSTSTRRLALVPRFRQRVTGAGPLELSNPLWADDAALRPRAGTCATRRCRRPGGMERAARARRPGDVGAARLHAAAVAALPDRGPGRQAPRRTSRRPTTRSSTGSRRSTSARSSSTRTPRAPRWRSREERWEPDEPSPEMLFVRDASRPDPTPAAHGAQGGARGADDAALDRGPGDADRRGVRRARGERADRAAAPSSTSRSAATAGSPSSPTELERLKDARGGTEATVNDVILSVAAGGLRRFFERRGERGARASSSRWCR